MTREELIPSIPNELFKIVFTSGNFLGSLITRLGNLALFVKLVDIYRGMDNAIFK